MVNQFLSSTSKSIYLDTSFVLNALSDSIDSNIHITEESRQVIGILMMRENCNCYISNIVLNEIYNVIEKTGFQVYIDKQIIKLLSITEEIWKGYTKKEREQLRFENSEFVGLNCHRDIKRWRSEELYKEEYDTLVVDEFDNIMAGLPIGIKIVSNFLDQDKILYLFIKTKKKYNKLDSNDVNHYLLCKEHNIDGILTCDSDFKQIKLDNKNSIEIIVIDYSFKLY